MFNTGQGDISLLGCDLKMTCFACPEQYDVYHDGMRIGYLRLRHGQFTADYVDPKKMYYNVFSAFPRGDGNFEPEERMSYLTQAVVRVCKRGGIPILTDPNHPFAVRQKVMKVTGDYQLAGEIIGIGTTKAGKVRYMVEHDNGIIHIYNAANLIPL